MKKLAAALLVLLLAAALPAPAMADVLWEPMDEFYWQKYDECLRTDAEYEALTDATIRKSPVSRAEQGTIPAGEIAFVYYRWEDWGYIEGDLGTGWIDLHAFRKLYGSSDFAEEHADEIRPESGTVPRAENEIILLWTFPRSGVIASRIDREEYAWSEIDPAYSALWTDEDGLRWGRVDYYYALRGWVCLDEPGEEGLPGDAPRYAEDDIDTLPAEEAGPENGTALLTAALLAAVIAVTAAILLVFVLKKKKSGTE